MSRVATAIEQGRCALAVSGSVLSDPQVLLALRDRPGLPAIALSGPVVAPAQAVNADAVARAAQPDGVLVVVAPQTADMPSLKEVMTLLGRAPHKPTVVVADRTYNPFAFAGLFQGFQVEHMKVRGRELFKDLPMPPPPEALPAPETPKLKPAKAGAPDAPRFAFVGREDELSELEQILGSGGPVVLSGPAGIGKTWLIEQALAQGELNRLPDVVLGWGCGFDTLAARLAEVARLGGNADLHEALAGRAKPAEVARAAVSSLAEAEGTEGQVMVVHDLHKAMGRNDDFFRKSRLEMLLEALLTHSYPLRLVFTSRAQPVFHRERAGHPLRRLTLGGLKGRYFHEIFAAYKAPEVPRDRFGPLCDRIHGHPMVARQAAVEVRERPEGAELLDDPKFFKMEAPDDLGALRKRIDKRVEKLSPELREALAVAAHFRVPAPASLMADAGLPRKPRLQLLALGLLDMVGDGDQRRFRVHPLVRSALSPRETSSFDVLRRLGQLYGKLADGAEGVERLAWAQEANRNFVLGRHVRSQRKLELPDDDPVLEGVTGMIRARRPQGDKPARAPHPAAKAPDKDAKRTPQDLAADRLREVLARNPANADAWLLRLELSQRTQASRDAIQQAIDEAIEKAPVPELFHQAVAFFTSRRARGKAVTALEQAVELLPDESRLRTRLATFIHRQGRRKEAIDHLKEAMAQDPMLPDAYGLLGTFRREEGLAAMDEAETLLREAVRLAPGDATQACRLVDLLLERARLEPDRRDALREQAREHLEPLLRHERKLAEPHLLMATLVREEGQDMERAGWLLKQARRATERNPERMARIQLEEALVALGRGDVELAEKTLRKLAEKEPANPRVFAALGQVLEARQLYIPAHAEYTRAAERAPRESVDAVLIERELSRLQSLIEAQAAGLAPISEPEPAPAPKPMGPEGHQRVIRRRRQEASEGEAHGEGEASSEGAANGEGEAHGEGEASSEGAANGEGEASREGDANGEGEVKGAQASDEPSRPSGKLD